MPCWKPHGQLHAFTSLDTEACHLWPRDYTKPKGRLPILQGPGPPHLEAKTLHCLPVDGRPKRHLPGRGVFSTVAFLCLWQPLQTIAQDCTGAAVNTSVQELALQCMQSLAGSIDPALPWEKSSLWPSLPETLYLHNGPLPTQALPLGLVITGSGLAQALFVTTWKPFASAAKSSLSTGSLLPTLPLLPRASSSVLFLLG